MELKNMVITNMTFQEARIHFLKNREKEKFDFFPFDDVLNYWRDTAGVPRYSPGYIDITVCKIEADSLNLQQFSNLHPHLHLIEFELIGAEIYSAQLKF